MKALYIDASMGIAGDMLTAALVELMPSAEDTVNRLNKIGIPNVEYRLTKLDKSGIMASHIEVLVGGVSENDAMHTKKSHTHHSIEDIEHIINELNLPDKVKNDIKSVYNIIAQAESKIHGEPVSQIHFHEVGEMDAIADITAVCTLLDELKLDSFITSPINVGNGTVTTAHGVLSVPAPATENILQGIPIYSDGAMGELCTPTGAALIKYYANAYGNMPPMAIEKVGYGAGKRDYSRANVVRVSLGELINISENTDYRDYSVSYDGNIHNDSADILEDILNKKKELINSKLHIVEHVNDTSEVPEVDRKPVDRVIELRCNIDDQSAERIAYAIEILIVNGALDAFSTPITMKKGRLGTLLTVICTEARRDEIVKLIFKHTTTIGIRETVCNRYVLKRETETVKTDFGNIRVKKSVGYGVEKQKYEYDDLKNIAKSLGLSIDELIEKINS